MRKLLNKLRGDKADAPLVFFVVTIPVLILVFGFVADTGMNITQKQSYTDMAQRAAQVSIKSINASGTLDKKAINAFVGEYRAQRNGASGAGVASAGAASAETGGRRGRCTTAVVDGKTRTLPYIKVRLDKTRDVGEISSTASPTFTIEGNGAIPNLNLPRREGYRVLSATVYEASQNSVLGLFGQSCQVYKNQVSGIAFGSQGDL